MNNIQYIYSTLSNWKSESPFYDDNLHDDKLENYFHIQNPGRDWEDHVGDGWHYIMNKKQVLQLPKQGWKIHITASLIDAQDLLNSIAIFLIQSNISFKFIPSFEKLKALNSKYANRAESGKFITIYPKSEQEFLGLLDKLKKITDGYQDGPYILNDKQWKKSNVFFRYGAFKKMTYTDANGKIVNCIMDPDGNLIEDKRVPYYFLPDFVSEPKEIMEQDYSIPKEELTEFNKYVIDSVLHYSNGGGVYKAKLKDDFFVLKEGRKGAGIDARGIDAYQRINKEFVFLNRLKDLDFIVSPHKTFTAWLNNYLVEDYVEGKNLDAYIVEEYPLVRNKDGSYNQRKEYNKNTQSIVKQLIEIVNSVHEKGVALGDLQPANIIYCPDGTIKVIDLENADDIRSKYRPGLQTLGFVPKKIDTFGDADWYALKCIAYSLFMPAQVSPSLVPNIYSGFKIKIKDEFG